MYFFVSSLLLFFVDLLSPLRYGDGFAKDIMLVLVGLAASVGKGLGNRQIVRF